MSHSPSSCPAELAYLCHTRLQDIIFCLGKWWVLGGTPGAPALSGAAEQPRSWHLRLTDSLVILTEAPGTHACSALVRTHSASEFCQPPPQCAAVYPLPPLHLSLSPAACAQAQLPASPAPHSDGCLSREAVCQERPTPGAGTKCIIKK